MSFHPNILISKILKKKNRFGLFFKRLVTLTDEPKLAYTDEGGNQFKKIIDLSNDTKLTRMSNVQFKLSYTDKS